MIPGRLSSTPGGILLRRARTDPLWLYMKERQTMNQGRGETRVVGGKNRGYFMSNNAI